ncbi:MAG TPA: hypothetical protein VIC55_10420 [Gemmatimonadaceae bacterium]|jgi:hypothetical protein
MTASFSWAAGLAMCLGLAARGACAQDSSDSAAYHALTQTPIAALAPLFDISVTGGEQQARSVAVHARYGIMSFDSHEYTHDFGLSVVVPVGSASLSATGGYYFPNCTDHACRSHVMGSVGLSQNLAVIGLGRRSDGASMDIGLTSQIGFAHPSDTTLISGAVSLPVSLVPSPRGLRLVPYISPGVGVGVIRPDSGTEAGLQFLFAAGVGLLAHGFTATVALSRVFLPGGNWLVGVGLSFGDR